MSFYNKYNRGSEWRKWDLQIHTPASHLSNGFGTDWDKYVQELFKRAISNDIAAIGITDYFTIDGYKKIKLDYLDKPEKLKQLFTNDEIQKLTSIFVFPNIEFRLNKLVGSNRINFHVILSDKVSINDIEENFLHEIDFVYEAGPQTPDEKRKLKYTNLEQLGRKLIQQHEHFKGNSEIRIGMMNAVVDDGQICELLANKKNIFEDKYLIALPCDEDLSTVSWNGQDHQARKLLIQKSDMLIASNPNTISWALGKRHSNTDEFIAEYKTIKPCVGGSDAHTFDEMFVKNKERLLWIKADPTFIGLKQIIYEPEDRVRIQANLPESKAGYQVIDRIEINNPIKYNKSIKFNPNLNSIIGGRSTGKSILLGAIAKKVKTIRPIEFPDIEYDKFIQSIANSIKVIWKDGKEENNREIEYFQQGYMHVIARDEKKLSKLIQDILLQKGKEPVINTYNRFLAENSKLISNLVNDFFQVLKSIIDKEQKARDKGDKKGIEDEIQKLADELKILNVTEITEEEKIKYNETKESINKASQTKQTILTDIQQIEILKTASLFKDSISLELTAISEDRKKTIETTFDKLKTDAIATWQKELLNIINDAKKAESTAQESIDKLIEDVIYIKVSKAFTENAQLAELEQKIELQKKKLFEINNLYDELENLKKQRDSLKDNIRKTHQLFYLKIQEVIPQLSDTKDGLDIKAKAKFDNSQYQEILASAINQKSYENQQLVNFNWTNNEVYETHVFELFDSLIDNQLTLKGGFNNQSFANSILSIGYYHLTYDVEYESDDFRKMSDGKKAFVVLKLLLDFSDKDCPILIDQPEDDLDNRAIYLDLVQYLIKKKKLRQIIVATHNPNIVVGADSELVVCANQHGEKNANTDEKKFQYVAGGLEHTFEKIKGKKEVLEAQGIREHVCEVLEGGDVAFKLREKKYSIRI